MAERMKTQAEAIKDLIERRVAAEAMAERLADHLTKIIEAAAISDGYAYNAIKHAEHDPEIKQLLADFRGQHG